MNSNNTKILLGKRQFSDEQRTDGFVIEYFRIERETEDEKLYGIGIEKSCPAEGGGANQSESFETLITSNAEKADLLIEKLMTGGVTPITAPETIDALYEEIFEG